MKIEKEKKRNRNKNVIVDTRIVGGYHKPQAPEFFASNGGYIVNQRPDLPEVQMIDEYGRLYQAQTYFRPMPVSGPVAVPVPSAQVQLTPIVTPLSVVPYMSQEQPLYQYEEED